MPIQTPSNLSNSVRTAYANQYKISAMRQRVYDQFSQPIGKDGVEQAARLATTVQVNFLSDMVPGTQAIPTTADINPQVLRDATATITPTSRGEALELADLLNLQVFTDYGVKMYDIVGRNQMETVEALAKEAALAGNLFNRAAARSSLDAGTTGHRLTDTVVSEVDTMLQSLKCPPFIDGTKQSWGAAMRPEPYHDLRLGGNIVNMTLYQDKETLLNFELGRLGPFKLIVNPFCHMFLGQGAANASAVNTTLNGAVKALDKQIIVASGTNISSGKWLNIIDAAESGATLNHTNERVKYVSGTTTVVIVGEGPNGGLRFDHPTGVAVTNADTVYPVLFGGPYSMAKLFDAPTGEFGKTVGVTVTGILEQFQTLGWKFYGGYGRWVESWLLRGEYACSIEA
jgi:hypothetical protein